MVWAAMTLAVVVMAEAVSVNKVLRLLDLVAPFAELSLPNRVILKWDWGSVSSSSKTGLCVWFSWRVAGANVTLVLFQVVAAAVVDSEGKCPEGDEDELGQPSVTSY